MAVVDEEREPGSAPRVVIGVVVVFIILMAVLFIGLGASHWFGFNSPAGVQTAPSVTPTPSAAASASASP